MNPHNPNSQELHMSTLSNTLPIQWLYILSNSKPNGPLYLGNTACLMTRMHEHLNGSRRDYAHYHRLTHLVYFEAWEDEDKFKARIRRVRNWPRDMRLLLIGSGNPHWHDLWPEFERTNLQKMDHKHKEQKAAVA